MLPDSEESRRPDADTANEAEGGGVDLRVVLANAVIVGVLILQLIPFVFDWWVYPFIDYPMYSDRPTAGPRDAARTEVVLTTLSGERLVFLPEQGQELSRWVSWYGLSQSTYRQNYLIPMFKGCGDDESTELALELGRRLNSLAPDPISRIDVQAEIFRLRDGSVEMLGGFVCLFPLAEASP